MCIIIVFIDERLPSEKADDDDNDDDFKVNVQMFSQSPSPTNPDTSDGSINPMKGLQMAELAFSDDGQSEKMQANNKLEDKIKSLTVSDKDIRSVVNDLSEPAEVLTEDEVEEEIEEDVVDVVNGKNDKITDRQESSPPRTLSDVENQTTRKREKTRTKSQNSYTSDFSSLSEIETHNERSHSQTQNDSKGSRSSRRSRSFQSSRSSEKSRSSHSSRSSQSARSSRSSRSTKHSRSSDNSRSKQSVSEYSNSKVKNETDK